MPELRTLFSNLGVMLVIPVALVSAGSSLMAQDQATPPAAATRFLGTITAVGTGLLTVKTDAGVERKVTVPDGIRLQQVAPGEKDLSKAATIQFSTLAVGDRVLVRIAPEPTADPVTAVLIVDIPKADLAKKEQADREDWQRRGVGGLVKSVDPGTGIIVIVSGTGAAQKTTTLHTTPTTTLNRYASDSVDFAKAKPAPLGAIQPGDQLRARGTKSADGSELAAEDVVSGTFRNIAGTISAVNQKDMTLTLKDLATKQSVIVHIGPDAQMHKLPENLARTLAASTTGGADAAPAGAGDDAATRPRNAGMGGNSAAGSAPASATPGAGSGAGQGAQAGMHAGGGAGAGQWQGQGQGGGRRTGGDAQQMISHAPEIHLTDLQKGDAVMLVSTQGASDVTAITLLAGVEPLLQAPASTQNMLLSNWSMGSGGAEAAAQ